MRLTPAVRVRIAAAVSALTVLASAAAVRAQFSAPTCVPPLCNPEVIQNIDVDTGSAQVADINITGDAKLGSKFQVGSTAPVLTQATENLYYGNVGGTSTNGSLLLLQMGGADRMRITLAGQQQLPLGSLAAPSYSFIGDTNTGFYSPSADSVNVVTGGIIRVQFAPTATFFNTGVLNIPVGSVGSPSLTFSGDTNTGIYRSAADTLNFVTNGISRLQIDANGAVLIPGNLTVQGTFTASGGLGGDGSAITNLNASNITTGTLNDARLSSNVALLDRAAQTFTGNNTFSGMTSLGSAALVTGAGQNMLYGVADSTSAGNLMLLQSENAGVYTDRFRVAMDGAVTAGSFSGVGTNLTALNATQLTSGTVPSARLSGTYSNSLTFSNRTNFGSATLNVAAGTSLIYGNVDTASAGNLIQLQNESVDRFRVDAAGNLILSGTVTASGSLTSGGVSVCLQNGTNCPASLGGGGTGSGTDGYISRFTGASTLGDSVIYQDGSNNVGIGTTSPSAKLSVNGSITAQGVSTYLVAAGASGVVGQVVGVGSTGVTGSGGSYGVYGSSGGYGIYGYNTSAGGSGAGVYGYHGGTGPGVQGVSASGWGGSFSSLYVTPGTAYFASGASMGSGVLTLGNLGFTPSGSNGGMYYDTSLGSFRCYSGGAWGSCGVTGSGTTNYVPRFTGSSTLGNSTIQDNGSTASVGGNPPSAGVALAVGPTNLSNAFIATTNAANGVGIYGFGLGSGSIGLYGQGQGSGVSGVAGGAGGVGLQGTGDYAGVTGTTANVWGYGVQGSVSGSNYRSGIYGITSSSQYTSAGVMGVSSGNGMGGYFQSNNATTYALSAYNGGNPTTGYAFQAEGTSRFTGSVSMSSSLGVAGGTNLTGSVVIGDAASDVFIINSSAATIPNGLNFDLNTLYIDAVNNRVGIANASPTSALDVTGTIRGTGAGAGVYGTAGSNGGIGVQGVMTAIGGYGVYGSSSGSGGNGVYGNAGASNGIGVNGLGGYAGVAGTGPYGVYGDGASSGTYAAGVYGTGYHGVEGVAENNGYGVYGTGYYGVLGSGTYMGLYGQGGTYGVYATGSSYAIYGNGANYFTGTTTVGSDFVANFNSWGTISSWFYCELDSATAGWQYCTCPSGSFVMSVALYNPGGYGVARDLATQCAKP